MRKIFISILFALSTLIASATQYYVATAFNGGNNSNNGSIGSPWLTVAYAASQVSAGSHTINIGAGTFNEGTNEIVLALGVSLDGAGKTSTIIISHYTSNISNWQPRHGAITMTSNSTLENGNQHVSNLTLDGELQTGNLSGTLGYVGIMVFQRSNVIIHDCIIQNFWSAGLLFYGTTFNYGTPVASLDSPPPYLATGNQIYNCSILNCTDEKPADGNYRAGSLGCLVIGSQTTMEIHDNIFTQNQRPQGHNGDIIMSGWWEQGVKIYNNTFTKIADDGASYNFIMEIWNTTGGMEVYDNYFYGGDCVLNIAGPFNVKGTYDYSWYVHNNTFEQTNITQSLNANNSTIIMEDEDFEDVIFERNRFYHCPRPFSISDGSVSNSIIRNITLAYNIFESCGWNNNTNGSTMIDIYGSNVDIDNIDIYNNVFYINPSYNNSDAVWIRHSGTANNINIKNNIAVNSGYTGWVSVGNYGTLSGLYVNYNLAYNCINSNIVNINPNDGWFFNGSYNSISNYNITTGNITGSNPLFVSSTDFRLQSGSPARDAGTNVGITSDYLGYTVPYNGTVDIGAYEYGASGGVSTPTVTTSDVTSITQTTASGGGNVTSDGGASVTARGICWGTSANPTTSGNKTTDGSGTGSFTSSLTGLSANTTYHVRAYASNSAGTSYGADVQFTTSVITSVYILKSPSGSILKSSDGKILIVIR